MKKLLCTCGVTNNLERRVYEHKNKLLKGFTQKYNLNKLVYYEIFEDIEQAILREKQLKKRTRQRKNELINKFNREWLNLYSHDGQILTLPPLSVCSGAGAQDDNE